MILTFRKHCVMSWWSRKARLTSGHGCFADQSFAFVKVSFLLADVHDDPRLSGSSFIVPPACGSGAWIEARLIRCWGLFATRNNQRHEQSACNSQYSAIIHKAADTIHWELAHSTLKSVLIGWMVASEKRRVFSRRGRTVRLQSRSENSSSLK